MQQTQRTKYDKLFIGLTGTTWVVGLLLAGSDSPYMPWLNGLGLLLFLCASILMGKLLNPGCSISHRVNHPRFYQKFDARSRASNTKNYRVNRGYALGLCDKASIKLTGSLKYT